MNGSPLLWKVIVDGPFSSGKTQFIRTISEYEVIWEEFPVDSSNPKAGIAAFDSGLITTEEVELYLFGTPGARRFSFSWSIAEENVLGFVIMVDSACPQTFQEAASILATFVAYEPAPYVVAINKQDKPDAWGAEDLRHILRVPKDVPVVPCVATDKESVKRVLLALLERVLSESEN